MLLLRDIAKKGVFLGLHEICRVELHTWPVCINLHKNSRFGTEKLAAKLRCGSGAFGEIQAVVVSAGGFNVGMECKNIPAYWLWLSEIKGCALDALDFPGRDKSAVGWQVRGGGKPQNMVVYRPVRLPKLKYA